ncbi:DUF2589 domain-containing protein [Dawidia soli]|uniref:DUF2589 domain-containing protein n=1 Tax=Dawidia soli TaxID=2782352 RepID=A0AAP2DBK1_9BACT|nr:DUF2589 domain-containing protein [Dawidia soli]MBT1686307.1 DUF2589 domain-containing protein [Dawidia soli]
MADERDAGSAPPDQNPPIPSPHTGPPPEDQKLSLSAALLAPLNSIFEAQVQSARAFLNFILQIGFRHQYTKEERSELDAKIASKNIDPAYREELLRARKDIEQYDEARTKIAAQLEKARDPNQTLDPQERADVEDFYRRFGDLYQQCFSYLDGGGNMRTIYVPNLALLPVQPLGIDTAKFKFSMEVSDTSEKYDQMGTVQSEKQESRPWYLIQPKSVRGTITSGTKENHSRSIEVEMNIKAGDMPYGLHQMLTAITNISADTANKSNT